MPRDDAISAYAQLNPTQSTPDGCTAKADMILSMAASISHITVCDGSVAARNSAIPTPADFPLRASRTPLSNSSLSRPAKPHTAAMRVPSVVLVCAKMSTWQRTYLPGSGPTCREERWVEKKEWKARAPCSWQGIEGADKPFCCDGNRKGAKGRLA